MDFFVERSEQVGGGPLATVSAEINVSVESGPQVQQLVTECGEIFQPDIPACNPFHVKDLLLVMQLSFEEVGVYHVDDEVFEFAN